MRTLKAKLIFALITLALLALLEAGARYIEQPRAVLEIETMNTEMMATRTLPPALPSWATDDRCANAVPARLSDFEPGRPASLGDGLPQIAVESYYSPLSLKESEWPHNAFQPKNPTSIVAIMGSSMIAGDGLPCQEFTLSSQLQRLLNDKVPDALSAQLGGRPRVDNLGQSAFVSYNQYLLLINLLRYGYRPQIVVFYQGFNDAIQRVLQASPHFAYGSYAIGATGKTTLRYTLRESLLSRSALARLLTGEVPRMNNIIVEGRDHHAAVYTGSASKLMSDQMLVDRATSTAREMFSEAEQLGRMAEIYKFTLVVINHPTIFSKRVLADSEATLVKLFRETGPAYEKATELTQRRMHEAFQASLMPHVKYRDMRDCFGDASDAFFIDMTHVTGRGNELLARCMLENLSEP